MRADGRSNAGMVDDPAPSGPPGSDLSTFLLQDTLSCDFSRFEEMAYLVDEGATGDTCQRTMT
jgi:hypothetical protein